MADLAANEAFHKAFETALRLPEPAHTAGMNVYRNNSRAAFLRVLEETFPVVRKIVGEEFFRYLAHEFYQAYPATSPWVRLYGGPMPDFLESFEPVVHLKYLPDVARLELLWLESYHAPEAAPLALEDLQASLASETAMAAKLRLHPSVRLLESNHPAATLWHHNRGEGGAIKISSQGEHILLVRPDITVNVTAVPEALFKAIALIDEGRSLEAAVLTSADKDPEQHLTDVFRLLFQHQLVVSVEKEDD
ncbi:MAG: DUF2063 domain-containing protein [Alphaproteobacteria bacterium]|nr:MAG: DUF2063 domain-containing protein [Alphaproteobacteria bacterium]